jgi:hypothetical protein
VYLLGMTTSTATSPNPASTKDGRLTAADDSGLAAGELRRIHEAAARAAARFAPMTGDQAATVRRALRHAPR